MVQINSAFQNFFDCQDYTRTNNQWEIVENSNTATVKHLRIYQNDSCFFTYTDNLFKGMSVFSKRSSYLVDSDCDGFAYVYKDNSNKEQLLFADLKSRFSIQKIKEAYKQMIYSFLKLFAMQSICNGYSIDDQEIEMIVACKCFENQVQEEFVNNEILKGQQIDDKFLGLLYKLINNQHAIIKLNDFPPFKDIPLNESIKNKEIKITLVLTNSYNEDTVTYYK